MPLTTLCTFLFFAASLLSLWIRREPKIWGTLLALSLCFGLVAGHLHPLGLVFLLALLLLWIAYDRKPHFALFLSLIAFSALFKLHLLPGYTPFSFTPRFLIGLEAPLIGLFPLAFLVPLAHTRKEWTSALQGLLIGCVGIALLALLATLTGATHWQLKLPPFFAARSLSNLFLTSIPEEGFFRGFIQNTLCTSFKNTRLGNIAALLLTSLFFTAGHIYWSPNLSVLLFVFLASLLYGTVYLLSGKIESAILTHFLLNLIHMTFFSYHAS